MASLLLSLSGQTFAQSGQPSKVVVGGVELHYIEQGKGEVVILLHGGQGDYRAWQSLMDVLAPRHRVMSYSRRYHWPNANPLTATNHSALIDADDLAGFVTALDLRSAHAGVMPGAGRVTISQAGHGSPRENPIAFNAAVLEFLSRYSAETR